MESFICPCDKAPLAIISDDLVCPRCNMHFPFVGDVPILIDDDNSVFSRMDYVGDASYVGPSYVDQASGLRKFYRTVAVAIENKGNVHSCPDTGYVLDQIAQEHKNGRILVIGAGSHRFNRPNIVYTDVSLSPGLACICDAHALPFPDGYFTGVIAVAVFEHFINPWQCAQEVTRVLANKGHVYAVTPFLQPVHMGAYDFTRFSYLGHRTLFRDFDDIDSGCAMGPSKALAYLIPHVVGNIVPSKTYRRIGHFLGLLLAWPVKQFDRIIGKREASYDSAAGVYFWGRKRESPLSYKQIIPLFRGGR